MTNTRIITMVLTWASEPGSTIHDKATRHRLVNSQYEYDSSNSSGNVLS